LKGKPAQVQPNPYQYNSFKNKLVIVGQRGLVVDMEHLCVNDPGSKPSRHRVLDIKFLAKLTAFHMEHSLKTLKNIYLKYINILK
jgi:hypothetical protein